MSKFLFTCLLLSLLCRYSAFAANDKFVVVIDAGHGGKDTGATRGDYKEKSINLGVALVLGQLIESNMKNVKVVYTRKSDVFVDLHKRSDIANKAKANMFISIHTNSTASKITTAEGADTYILGLAKSSENLAVAKRENSVILLEDDYNKRYEGFDPNAPESYIIFEFMTDKYMAQSLEFASSVQKGFKNISRRKDRGVRQAGFLVLRESAMPSVLIELGFINNPQEAKYLSSTTGQRSMASSIYAGIEKYIRDFDKKQNGSSSNSTSMLEVRTTEKVKQKNDIPSEELVSSKIIAAREKVAAITNSTNQESIGNSNNISGNEINKDLSYQNIYVEKQPLPTTINEDEPEDNIPVINRNAEIINDIPKTENVNLITKKIESPATTQILSPKPLLTSTYSKGTIEYRVQILISQNKLSSSSSMFKGLYPIGEYSDDKIYKYTYGSTSNESEAMQIRNEIRSKFRDAFIVKFVDGVRVK